MISRDTGARCLRWLVAVTSVGGLVALGLSFILDSSLGVCGVKPTATIGNISSRAVCESWSHERGTSWALRFVGDVVQWNGEVGVCQQFLVARFPGELASEAECQEKIQEMTVHPRDYGSCVLDRARNMCYVQCPCLEESRRNSLIIGWLFIIGSPLALAISVVAACVVPKSRISLENVQNSQYESTAFSEAVIEQHFPAMRCSGSPQCVVCLSPVLETEMARQAQCGHTFHADCIMTWWTHRPRRALECPVCKQIQAMPPSSPPGGELDGQVIGAAAA
mmetsp:Transcript_21289/g.45281  ORF Transcript_21289/g.45281 Transcript_21289/m.45281 type:complete len:279 (-) Transcript_21289:27-863(-)